jgi:hypothetical protein
MYDDYPDPLPDPPWYIKIWILLAMVFGPKKSKGNKP